MTTWNQIEQTSTKKKITEERLGLEWHDKIEENNPGSHRLPALTTDNTFQWNNTSFN